MSSNMLSGDKRWASARRGSMTVLGKVAVPKPLNLPSQRHENHGSDPNVEIVPKGTLSWGSRPSSTGSSPWVSVASSNVDGGPGSPGHPNGRPLSGGSATRPSTAGSDKPHESVANVTLVSTSRPSSSSGTLSPNHTASMAMHPRSAENRPTSSHLSRFAEPVSKHPMAWGCSMAAEKMDVKSAKEDVFSLNSGDFPNLGSERDNLTKNNECEGNSRPRSASGRITRIDEDDADLKSVSLWNADGCPKFEDEKHITAGQRHGEPFQYFNANVPLQPFETWRGPPMNGPAGIWYGGHPRGPAVGIPNTPGGFPVDAFSYYHHQMPPPPLASSRTLPPPGAGLRGPHPNGGDVFRPQIPDSFTSPNMPFRPGFFPGTPGPMVFEGYYRPPIGYNERDVPPFIGIAAGHPVYNGFRGPGVDTGVSHGRLAARVPPTKASSEQAEAAYPVHNQAPKGPPEGNHKQRDGVSNSGRKLPAIHSRKNDWGAEEETDEVTFSKMETAHVADNKSASESGGFLSVSQGMRQMPSMSDKSVSQSEKIDHSNAKVYQSDGESDPYNAHCHKDERSRPHFSGTSCVSKDVSTVAEGVKGPKDHKTQPNPVLSRKHYKTRQAGEHSVDDNQQRRPLSSESWASGSARKVGSGPCVNTHILNASGEDGRSSVINQQGNERELVEPYISSDVQEQRTKKRELAKQRAVQLQKEEEERMREQKAKALAKLEELNRRTLSCDSAGQKAETMCDNQTSGEAQERGGSAIVDTIFLELLKDNILIRDDAGDNPFCIENPGDGHLKHEASESSDLGITIHKIDSNPFLRNTTAESGTVVNDAESDGRDTASDVLSHETLGSEAKPTPADTAKTSNAVTVSSAHQRRRNNRNTKYTHRTNEALLTSAIAEAMPTTGSSEVSIESAELKNSSGSHVLSTDEPDKHGNAQKNISSEPSEESDRKVPIHLKPQSRKLQRSQQGNRFVDKLHSNDNVIWAPVKSESKAEATVESEKKSGEVAENSTMDGSTTQNAPKGKRAEMERYVPKAVALELAQQSVNQQLSTVSSSRSVEGSQKEQSGVANFGSMLPVRSASLHVGSGSNTNEGDVRPGKLKKDTGTWRERVDSSETKIPESHPEKGVQQFKERPQSVKNNFQTSGHEIKSSGDDVISDDNGLLSNPAPVTKRNLQEKAQGPANGGKRQFNRGSRSTGSHYGSEFASGNEAEGNFLQSSAHEGNQTEIGNFSRENRSLGERISYHWQPKSQANPTSEQNRNQGLRTDSTTEVGKHPRKAHLQQHKIQEDLRHFNENNRTVQSLQGHVSVEKNTAESNSSQSREFEEKSHLSESFDVHSPIESQESAPKSGEVSHQHEKNFHSRSRGNVRQKNHSSRIHDSRGEWPPAYDNWKNATANGKPRQNVQPEYQPVVKAVGEQVDASNSSQRQGARRGQNQTKRVGNYYRRQSSSTSADIDATG